MTWTTRTPTQPGWYWFRRPSVHGGYHQDICRVYQVDIDVDTFMVDTEWSSEPIKEPEEQKELG